MKDIIIETDRLILRRFNEEDLNDLFEYLSCEEVVKYEPYKAFNLTEAKKHLDWLVSTEEMIAVELKSNHKVIGNIYLGNRDFQSLEIGFVFNKLYWNQGYAKESCSSIIKHSFKNGIHRIYAQCDPKNISFYNSSKFLHSTKIISSFICPKNDSIGALSQQFPRLDIDCSNPSLFYCFNE